jgi:bacteriorhodopsin
MENTLSVYYFKNAILDSTGIKHHAPISRAMYFIATICGAGFQTILFSIYVYNSIQYIGTPSEKTMYYATANVPFYTAILYSMALIQYGDAGTAPSPAFLNYFFIEWAITTPLLIANIGRVLHLPLYRYFIMSSSAIGMSFCGYLAHMLPRPAAFGAFAAGATLYVYCLSFLTYLYFNKHMIGDVVSNDYPPNISMARRVAKRLIIGVYSVWTVYPICFLLYLFEFISLDVVITAFIALDVASKGVFTSLLLGYYDYVNRHDSFLQSVVVFQRKQRIRPLPSPPRQLIQVSLTDDDIRPNDSQLHQSATNVVVNVVGT